MEVITFILLNLIVWGVIIKIIRENEKRNGHYTP